MRNDVRVVRLFGNNSAGTPEKLAGCREQTVQAKKITGEQFHETSLDLFSIADG
jgi:hypothetical protein